MSATKKQPSNIDRLYVAQAGECCYCGKVMLPFGVLSQRRFAEFYGLTVRQAKHRQATIEHIKRKAEGGTSHISNLAAACSLCNSKRQETSWVEYASQRQRSPLLKLMRAQSPQ